MDICAMIVLPMLTSKDTNGLVESLLEGCFTINIVATKCKLIIKVNICKKGDVLNRCQS